MLAKVEISFKIPKVVIPAHEDFGTRSKRNDAEEKLCLEEFLRATEDSNEDLLEDFFDLDSNNLPNFISEEDRIFNSKAGFRISFIRSIFGFVIFFGWWRYNQVKHRILILTHHRSGSTFTGELFNLHSQKGFQIDAFSSLMSHQPSPKCLQCLFNINQFENQFQTFYMFEPLRYASGASDLHKISFMPQTEMLGT